MRKLICVLLSLLMAALLPAGALGDRWYSFQEDEVPQEPGFLVNEFTGDITITFLGDCTLGGESTSVNKYNGYVQTINRNGYAYPFKNLLALTGSDDLTVANLEGVLSDNPLDKVEKEFNFMGPADFAKILTEGSIECVTLANNHSHDYGAQGYADTKAALEAEQVAYFGSDGMAVWERDGLMIGFVGVSGDAGEAFERQVSQLWDMGCCCVILFMHAGRENEGTIIDRQRQNAKKAAELGCTLVIGSHPHVVQGYDEVDGMPVVYSLGNCSFGGNHNPSDKDALAVQAVIHFEEGAPSGVTLHLYPISVSSTAERNNFCPRLLSGSSAERVLKKMEASTGWELPEYQDGAGAVIECGKTAEE